MECREISDLLIDYIDNQIDKQKKEMVEKHLNDCEHCKKEYRQLTELFSVIEQTPEIQPDTSLKNSFEKILVRKKESIKEEKGILKITFVKKHRQIWQVAAAILLLITGYLAGYNTKQGNGNEEKLASMQNDVAEMKQMMALSLLKDESASQRIKAVNFTEEIQQPDNQVIDALINTLNTDGNSNVRLAAIYSLARFKSNQQVRDALINTLNKQDDPMVQIVIINLLVEMEEVKALDELKRLLKNKDLHDEVKTQAEIGLKALS